MKQTEAFAMEELISGYCGNHLAHHITISQQIKSADGISILLSYTL